MAMAWLEATPERPIDAFIGIGMGATDYQQPMQRPFPFATLKIPVLDIYGSEDYPAVHRLAPIRLEKIQLGGHLGSTQVVVDGADHDFTANTEAMTQTISTWLDSLRL
jgi:pimeloyl-ACP methyl ester carboxylesterase